MQTLCRQNIPAISDIDQHYKENMDKTEAYKVPGAEGRSWLWGFLPKCQQSVNSLSNVTKIQLQDVIRRAEVSLFRGQPLEQKETVHTIKNTQKNSLERSTHFWLLANGKSNFLFQAGKTHSTIKDCKTYLKKKKSSIPNVFYANRTKISLTHNLTIKKVLQSIYIILAVKQF